MPNWEQIGRTAGTEVSRARSSRCTRESDIERTSGDPTRYEREHDEFLAKALMFERINRICMINDPDAIAGAIDHLADVDPPFGHGEKRPAEFRGHWREAFDYAIQQCRIGA